MAERADHGAAARAARAERARRVAAVMRENLKKRKEQGRARDERGREAGEQPPAGEDERAG